MFDELFILKLVVSFIISGAWAVFALKIAEKTGTKLGSIILTLPSTTLWALLFIGWIQGVDAVTPVAKVSLETLGVGAIFVLAFVMLLDKFKLFSIVLSLLIWAILSAIISLFSFNILESLFVGLLLFLISFILLKDVAPKKTKSGATNMQMFVRFLIVGSLVSITIIASKLAGPEIGGVLSVFPAMFVSSFYIAYKDYGEEFTKAMAANTIYAFPGLFVYVLAVCFFYPIYGLVLGTVLSYIVSLLSIILFNLIFKR